MKPSLALGISASLVFAIWLTIAFGTLGRIAWIEFSARGVLYAALSVKEISLGSNLLAIVLLLSCCYGLINKASRPLFFVFLAAFILFTLLPIITSFVQPILRNRYWMIGAAAIPVLVLFAARTWILEKGEARRAKFAAGGAVLCLLVASSILGIANAKRYQPSKGFWRGADLVRPLVAQCGHGSVHVYYENPSKPYVPLPWEMWDFHKLTGAPEAVFADAREGNTRELDASASSCPVLGWAEDSYDWQKLGDADLIRLLKIRTSLNEVQIVRHETGFVVLKRPSEPPAS